MLNKIVFIIIIFFLQPVAGQQLDSTRLKENGIKLADAFKSIYSQADSTLRDSINSEIVEVFEKILSDSGSFNYPWNELDMIGKVRSEDHKIKIFTWYIEKSPHNYQYYGFLQLAGNEKSEYKPSVFFLNDQSASLKTPELQALSPEKWYGALYFGLKTFTSRKNTYYVLLGYDFNNAFSDKKLIEVLTLSNNNRPVFEGNFQMELLKIKRVIFEYSSEVVMSLRYHEKLNKIVFDHLSPMEPFFTKNYRFYTPDGTYDAFIFTKDEFVLEHDVDARNY